jgi:hypothetical protein
MNAFHIFFLSVWSSRELMLRNLSHLLTLQNKMTTCLWYDMIYLSTAIGLTPGGSSTVHIYTQRIHRITQIQTIHRTSQITNYLEECGPCHIFASFTLTFTLQPRKKHGKTSVRVAEEWRMSRGFYCLYVGRTLHLMTAMEITLTLCAFWWIASSY